jgi:hypothetical protein
VHADAWANHHDREADKRPQPTTREEHKARMPERHGFGT